MSRSKRILSAAAIAITAGALACAPSEQSSQEAPPMTESMPFQEMETVTQAVAVLHPTQGSEAHGVVRFLQTDAGVQVLADIEGLTSGAHGFHVHQYGDCSAPDGTSAGGHFNPDGTPHGAPTATERHVGDLGNITVDEMGRGHLEWTDTLLSFAGPHSILGRGVIVHAGADDLTSQPTGNAGGRVACGVIGIAHPDS
jgi:Cu-Zn family superoxide dismutase